MTTTATKERPILFSAPMVRAILDGRKTMTRRILKWDGLPDAPPTEKFCTKGEPAWQETCDPGYWIGCDTNGTTIFARCPFGVPGDRLWVREKYTVAEVCGEGVGNFFIVFEDEWGPGDLCANEPKPKELRPAPFSLRPGVHPSIHLPRSVARLTLEVVSVRVERLQEISVEDAKAEGVEEHDDDGVTYYGPFGKGHVCAVSAFAILWEEINGPGSWSANPWVWRIEFRRLA